MMRRAENFNVIYNKNQNCFGLCVNAILSRSPKVITPLIWNQAGTVIHYNEESVSITPFYEDIETHLLRVANIQTEELNFSDFEKFNSTSIDLMDSTQSIILCVDVYELPFNMYYKEKHSIHYIEVYDIDDDFYYLCDHFYKYKGKVPKEVILTSMTSAIKQGYTEYFKLYYFDLNNIDLTTAQNLNKIIETNININEGCLPKQINLLTYSDKKHILGLNGFERFIDYIKYEVIEKHENISQTYRSLYGFGSSRLNYAEYLSEFESNLDSLRYFVDGYEEIGQKCKIVANNLLRLNYVNLDTTRKEKLVATLLEVYKKEIELTSKLNEHIIDY
jgi:hypothetical protein